MKLLTSLHQKKQQIIISVLHKHKGIQYLKKDEQGILCCSIWQKKYDTCIAGNQKYLKLGHLILNNIVGGKDRHTTILHTAVDPFLSTSPIKAVICALEVCLLKINQNKTEIQTIISTQVFRFGSMPLPFLQRYQSYQKFLLIIYPQSNNYYISPTPFSIITRIDVKVISPN